MKIWLLGVLAFALSSMTACTKKSDGTFGLDVKDTLRIHVATEPPTLDWHKSTDTTSSLITTNLMEGLTTFDFVGNDIKTKPALAESWTSNATNTVWIFKIRQGVKWSDGKELTAQHFVDGWERLLNQATASEYSYYLFNVKNAKLHNEGKLKDVSTLGVVAKDAHTLVVTLEQPQSFFPALLNHASTFPVRLDVVAKHGDKWTEPGNIVTLGAYNLKTWEHDKVLVLERNESYHGEKAKTKNIIGRIVPESSTALKLFEKGELDAVDDLPTLDIPRLKTRDEYKSTPVLVTYFLGYNVKKAPFDNVLVRKALAMAIDKKEITNLTNGGQIPINGWLPKGMPGYDETIGNAYNPQMARQLLAQAGYPEGKGFPKIQYGFNTNESHQRIAENIQQQLKRNLAINIELKNEEWKVYLKTLNVDAYHIYRMGWVADFADADNFLGIMLSDSGNNRGGYKSPAYDKLVLSGVMIKDPEKRKEIYAKAQKLLTETDAAVIPIYSGVNNAMISSDIKNYPKNAMLNYDYKDAEVVR